MEEKVKQKGKPEAIFTIHLGQWLFQNNQMTITISISSSQVLGSERSSSLMAKLYVYSHKNQEVKEHIRKQVELVLHGLENKLQKPVSY